MAANVTYDAPKSVPPVLAMNEQVTGPIALSMLQSIERSATSQHTKPKLLNIGCGAGIVSAVAKQLLPDLEVVAADLDANMVKVSQRRGVDSGWSGFSAVQADVQDMPNFADGSFTHVVGNMTYNFVPDVEKALTETARVLAPGGSLHLSTWAYIPWWPIAHAAMRHYVSEAPRLPDAMDTFITKFGQTIPSMKAALEAAGFEDVRAQRIDFKVSCSANGWAMAAAMLVQMVARKSWSEEEFSKFGAQIQNAMVTYVVEDLGHGELFEFGMSALVASGRKRDA